MIGREKLFPGFSTSLDENMICVMGCENSPSTKTLGTNLGLLELVQMPQAWKQYYWTSFTVLCNETVFYIQVYTNYFSCLDSQKKTMAGKTPF